MKLSFPQLTVRVNRVENLLSQQENFNIAPTLPRINYYPEMPGLQDKIVDGKGV
jgi:hypothetical protein